MNITRHIRVIGFFALLGISNINAGFSEMLDRVVSDEVQQRAQVNAQRNEQAANLSKINVGQAKQTVNLNKNIMNQPRAEAPNKPCASSRFSARFVGKAIIAGVVMYAGYKLSRSERVRAFVGRVKRFFIKKK